MPPVNKIIRFFLLVLLFGTVLLAPWPGLESGYARLFRWGGDALFSQRFWFWSDGSVRFLDAHSPDLVERIIAVIPGAESLPGYTPPRVDEIKDTVMVLMNRRTPASTGQLRTSSRYIAYEPIAMIVALVMATPMAWVKRGWMLLWGLILIHLFIALRLTLLLLTAGFAAPKAYALFHPGTFWRSVLGRAETVIADDPTVSYIIPVFVWFVVLFSFGGAWSMVRTQRDAGTDESGAAAA